MIERESERETERRVHGHRVMQIVLASNNAKKLLELQALLSDLPISLMTQGSLGIAETAEPYSTFIENALTKARHAAKASGGAALADDSGLCVRALGGLPGVASAHYAQAVPLQPARETTRAAQDHANNERLLLELTPHADRSAYFVSTLVALRHADDPEPLVAVGRWHGLILSASQGEGGFGYDPLMWIPELKASVAELPAHQKNALSHRAQSARLMHELLHQAWGLK